MEIKVLVFSDCGNAPFLEFAPDGRRFTEFRSVRDVPDRIKKAAVSCEISATVDTNGYNLGVFVYEDWGNAEVIATGNMVRVVADTVEWAKVAFTQHMGGVAQWLLKHGGFAPVDVGFEIRAYGDDPKQYPLQEGSQRYTVFTTTTVAKDLKKPLYFQYRCTSSHRFENYALGRSTIEAEGGPVEFINTGECVIVSGELLDDVDSVWQRMLQEAFDQQHS